MSEDSNKNLSKWKAVVHCAGRIDHVLIQLFIMSKRFYRINKLCKFHLQTTIRKVAACNIVMVTIKTVKNILSTTVCRNQRGGCR